MLVPSSTDPQLERGDRGFGVWSLQRGLNECGRSLAEDGVFGAETQGAVHAKQVRYGIFADGKVGPVTTGHMVFEMQGGIPVELPPRLLEGFGNGESGMNFAAVNWSVPGGVDCGIVERRVYDADLDDEPTKQRAFDPAYQLKLLASSLRRWAIAYSIAAAIRGAEQAWRTAALKWNYPSAADRIAAVGKGGLSSYYFTPQSWVPGVRFDDGAPVETPYEWMQFYALGAPEHGDPGLVTAVTDSWPWL